MSPAPFIMSTLDSSDISAIARMYLTRRNFTSGSGDGGEECTSLPTDVSLKEAAVECMAAGTVSSESVISRSVGSTDDIDLRSAETQFSRFRVWVLESPRQYRCQLQQLLFAVFVRLHVKLVSAGLNPSRFYSRHHSVFMLKPSQSQLVGHLASICSMEDLLRSSLLQRYRCEVCLSNSCLQYLQCALTSVSSSLPLIVRCIAADVSVYVDDRQRAVFSAEGSRTDSVPDPGSSLVNGPAETANVEAPVYNCPASDSSTACVQLQSAISALRASPPSLPAVCAYHILGAPLSDAALSPDQRVLVTCGDWGAGVWPLYSEGSSEPPRACLTSRVPLGGDWGSSLVEEVVGREGVRQRPLLGHVGSVYSVCVCVEDGSRLVTAGEDTSIRMWDADSCSNLCIYNGHTYPVWSVACQRFPGAQLFVSGSMDGTSRLWTFERTHPLRVFSGHNLHVDCVAIHQNGNYVCTASGDKTLRVWCSRSAAQVRCIADAHLGLINDIQFSPDGRLVASAGEDCVVRVFDVSSGKLLQRFSPHEHSVRCLVWTPDGDLLVSGDTAGDIVPHHISSDSVCEGESSNLITSSHSVVALHYTAHNYIAAVTTATD